MRSAKGADDEIVGGAWEFSAVPRVDEFTLGDTSIIARAATTMGEHETPCATDGCTKGACIAGIVLQQSWP